MIDPEISVTAAARSAATSLFDSVVVPDDAYNEAFSAPGRPREHWQSLITALETTGPAVLKKRQERVRRMRHEDGATFNPFDDPTDRETSWALDMIPMIITAGQWADLESGLIQRARLLEKILADTYGPQQLLKEALLPAELTFANPNFLHCCHHIEPVNKRFLFFYGADLYRGEDGNFRVLRDFTANPAGIGYALENRIVISRVFPELYHHTQSRRLAPFFQTFHHSLTQQLSPRLHDPSIVLLSPGPDSHIYFEHALLSRYLGYPLVESQDLTVRNGEVFLKKLAGLEPVAAIFRHIGDSSSDPFALRRAPVAGVAGLIQVCREQNIALANPIGSGFAETPVLSLFLPALCRKLMGEELQLAGQPTWWCKHSGDREYVQRHLDELVVGSAMHRNQSTPVQLDMREAIDATPHAFMALQPFQPSSAPVWNDNGIDTRPTILRVFACATDTGFTVMPGGLAITASTRDALIGNNPEQQQSKDVWVLSELPVEPVSLMSELQEVAEFRRSSDLPSRVADHLLWLGRYLERAEGLIRLLRSVFHRLSGEDRPTEIAELPFLLNLLREERAIPLPAKNEDDIPVIGDLIAHLNSAIHRKDGAESVVAILKLIQKAARNVRDRLSVNSWRVISRLENFTETPDSDPLELLDNTLFALSAFSGLAMESMTRSLGWRFLDMGRRIERGLNLLKLIRIGLPEVSSASRNSLEALLEMSDSIMTYRARYRTAFQLAPVLDLLLVDESNPKSLAFQINQLAVHVEQLPRQSERRFSSPEERMVLEMLTSVRLLELTSIRCTAEGEENRKLADFLDTMKTSLTDFAQQVIAHYLSRVPSTPHFSMIHNSRET